MHDRERLRQDHVGPASDRGLPGSYPIYPSDRCAQTGFRRRDSVLGCWITPDRPGLPK